MKNRYLKMAIDKCVRKDVFNITSAFFVKVTSILGFLGCFSFFSKFLNITTLVLLLIGAAICVVCSEIYYIYKYSRTVIETSVGEKEFAIMKGGYIENMIKILSENKEKGNTRIIFSMGMNVTVLDKISKGCSNEDIVYKSITKDFSNFMMENFNIDINVNIKKAISKGNMRQGDVFSTEYTLKDGKGEYAKLNDSKFTVIYYINSRYEENGEEIVEDPRYTIIHLTDFLNELLIQNRGYMGKSLLLMPIVGTGRKNFAYKNAIMEVINNMALPNSKMPEKVIFSLRDVELEKSGFEIIELVSLLKKHMKIHN